MAKEDKKSVFDVAKPGSTSPDTSAKPVIVSNRPMVKDPMVNEDTGDPEIQKESEEAESRKSGKGKDIKPINDSDVAKESPEPVEQSEPEQSEKSSEEAVVDAVVSQTSDKNKKAKEAEEAEERLKIESKLIESKKYFVKVKAPKAKRNKRTVAVILIVLLLGVIGFGVAADAELIDVNVPFDFIKKTPVASQAPAQVVKKEVVVTPQPAQDSKYTVPDGYMVYENKDLGFKFAYPKEYGDLNALDLSGQPDVDQVDSYFVSKSPTAQVFAGVNGTVAVKTYKTGDASVTVGKYGPEVQIKDGKLIVTKASSTGTINTTVGKEYMTTTNTTLAPVQQGKIAVFKTDSGDEGCVTHHLLFVTKDKLHEILLPEFCDNSYGNTKQPIIDPAKYNDLVQKISNSLIDVN